MIKNIENGMYENIKKKEELKRWEGKRKKGNRKKDKRWVKWKLSFVNKEKRN